MPQLHVGECCQRAPPRGADASASCELRSSARQLRVRPAAASIHQLQGIK
jgi:hypothetical protein